MSYVLKSENKNLLKVYLNYYFKILLYWYENLPKNKNDKCKYKEAMFNSFKRVEDIDYRVNLYKFLINTRLYAIYKIIKKIIIILNWILKKIVLFLNIKEKKL